MDWNTNLVDLFPVNGHGLDAFGDERLGDVVAPRARHLYSVIALDAQLVRQFHRNLDEGFGNELHVHLVVLCPVVIVLGESVGGADDVEAVAGSGVLVGCGLEFFDHRIVRLVGMSRIWHRTFDRFVVLGEGSIVEPSKQPAQPSWFMMNGPMWSLGGESALKSGTSLPTHAC